MKRVTSRKLVLTLIVILVFVLHPSLAKSEGNPNNHTIAKKNQTGAFNMFYAPPSWRAINTDW